MLNINTDWLYQLRYSLERKIISSEETLSYNELSKLADNYCAYLKIAGIKKGNNVAILSENNIHFIAAIFGAWRAKAVPVPLNTKLTVEEIKKLLRSSDSKFLIAQNDNAKEQFGNSSIEIINLYITENVFSDSAPDYNILPDETALIMYTSGSSGSPKGVELSFANFYASAENADEILVHTENDKWLASLPFYHIGGFSILIRAVLYGTSLVIPASMSYKDIVESIAKHKPTLISLVPTNLKRMIEAGVKPNKELRYVLLGGGPSANYLINKALDDGWNIVKVYGSTETSSLISAVDCRKNVSKAGSSGKALAGNEIHIYDDNFSELGNGISGNIAAAGRSVFSRYYNEKEHPKTKFHKKYYLTGDYGYLDDDGYLYVESRRTDLIISGGENISPLEIEEKLNILENIVESCVFPLDDKEWGQIAAAAVVVKKNYDGIEKMIQEELKKALPSFKIPKKIFVMDEIPKTSLGKFKREEIRNRFNGQDARQA